MNIIDIKLITKHFNHFLVDFDLDFKLFLQFYSLCFLFEFIVKVLKIII